MVVSCVVCGRQKLKNCDKLISFHRFPLNPKLKKEWILFTRRSNWHPSPYSRICSAHFQSDVYKDRKKRNCLIKGASPSIYFSKKRSKHEMVYIAEMSKIKEIKLFGDLSVYCRTCLTMTKGRSLSHGDIVGMISILEILLGFPLKLKDGDVFNICKTCRAKLARIFEFRNMCLYTNKKIESEKQQIHTAKVVNDSSSNKIVLGKRGSSSKSVELGHDLSKYPRLSNDYYVTKKITTSNEYVANKSTSHLPLNNSSNLTNKNPLAKPLKSYNLVEPNDSLDVPDYLTPDFLKDFSKSGKTSNLLSPEQLTQQVQKLISTRPVQIKTPGSFNSRRIDQKTKPYYLQSTPFLQKIILPKSIKIRELNQPIRQLCDENSNAVFKTNSTIKIKTKTACNLSRREEPNLQIYCFPKSEPGNNAIEQENLWPTLPVKVTSDHTYAVNCKHMRVGVHCYLGQYPVRDVLLAIEECKLNMCKNMLFCPLCQYSADNSSTLMISHMKRQHETEYPMWCSLCNKIVDNLAAHKTQRPCSTLFACKFCYKTFGKRIILLHHLEFHNKRYFHPHLYGIEQSKAIQVDQGLLMNNSSAIQMADETQRTDSCEIVKNTTNFVPLTSTFIKSFESLVSPDRIKQEINEWDERELKMEVPEEIQIKMEPQFEELLVETT